MSELSTETHDTITRLCAEGDRALEAGDPRAAIAHYEAAFAVVPEPYQAWEASTWVLTTIADSYFALFDFARCADYLKAAMHCPGAIGNPFIHLRLGQAQLELGYIDRAGDELMRAYMAAGPEIFEDENPKYLAFLKTVADIP